MADHCRMPDDPWLFRLNKTGSAKVVRTKFVRPGQKYVLMTLEPVSAGELMQAESVDMVTGGVHALRFEVPDDIDDAFINIMKRLGIGVVSDIAVWPTGLVPAFWDGEGRAAWLAGEDPMIGIRSTRRISRCVVSTSENVREFAWPEGDDRIFLQFTGLQIGTHLVDVHLFSSDDPTDEIAKGKFEIRLIEPSNSSVKSGARQAIQTRVYPARPTLEELWNGSASLEVSGPTSEKAYFNIRLTTRDGRETLVHRSCSSDMPVDEERWRELLKNVQDLQFKSSIDEAEEMHIIISNPVLGESIVIAERPFKPLRWSTGRDRDGPFAHLIDHIESDELRIIQYNITTPDISMNIPLNEEGEFRSSDGGLLVARAEHFEAAVVLAPHISGGGLASLSKLNVQPILHQSSRSRSSISALVELALLWTRVAVPADQFSAQQQSKVNDSIVASISEMITGTRWGKIELDICKGNLILENRLIKAAATSQEEYKTAEALLSAAAQTGKRPDERVDVFSSILDSHGWSELTGQVVPKHVDPILRLATVPGALDPDDSATTHAAIKATLQFPAVHRLARFFVLVLDGHHMNPYTSLLEDWAWL